MESNNTDNQKSPQDYSETNSSDSPSSANQPQGNNRDLSKIRRDGNTTLERYFHNQSKEYANREENKKLKMDSPAGQNLRQAPPFAPYSYNAIGNSSVDCMSQTPSVMPAYSMVPPMSTPWNVNPIDGMGVSHNGMPINQNPAPVSAGLKISQTSSAGLNSYAFVAMSGENMYSVAGMGSCGMMPPKENMFFPPIKEVVHLKQSVLYPPNPNAPRPTTRERPLGCKTVFLGGLPEKATEEIIKEIFDLCGTVESIRMSKKNFCHIRFSDEMFVDNAIYFSGYRLKIENKDETSYTGRLHVDFAQARDDQYEYECKMRALQCQARHQEEDCCRSVTPPVIHFSEREASVICDKLKNEETFSEAANILITWLERGECSKKNASSFYSMIQSTYKLVRMLHSDKNKCEEQLNEAKKKLKKQQEQIIHQSTDIEKIYKAASLQKNWDRFTKAQRKNIEMWKKQKNAHLEEVINEREDEEMELSEEESEDSYKNSDEELKEEYSKLQEENASLKSKLEDTQNEIVAMQSDHNEELGCKDSQLASVRKALQRSKKEELSLSQWFSKNETELKELREFKSKRDSDNLTYSSSHLDVVSGSSSIILEMEARLIGLISSFLHAHPFGASIDYICSYLHQIDSSVKAWDIENLMNKYPTLYREDSVGIGASLGKKWFFTGMYEEKRTFKNSDSSDAEEYS